MENEKLIAGSDYPLNGISGDSLIKDKSGNDTDTGLNLGLNRTDVLSLELFELGPDTETCQYKRDLPDLAENDFADESKLDFGYTTSELDTTDMTGLETGESYYTADSQLDFSYSPTGYTTSELDTTDMTGLETTTEDFLTTIDQTGYSDLIKTDVTHNGSETETAEENNNDESLKDTNMDDDGRKKAEECFDVDDHGQDKLVEQTTQLEMNKSTGLSDTEENSTTDDIKRIISEESNEVGESVKETNIDVNGVEKTGHKSDDNGQEYQVEQTTNFEMVESTGLSDTEKESTKDDVKMIISEQNTGSDSPYESGDESRDRIDSSFTNVTALTYPSISDSTYPSVSESMYGQVTESGIGETTGRTDSLGAYETCGSDVSSFLDTTGCSSEFSFYTRYECQQQKEAITEPNLQTQPKEETEKMAEVFEVAAEYDDSRDIGATDGALSVNVEADTVQSKTDENPLNLIRNQTLILESQKEEQALLGKFSSVVVEPVDICSPEIQIMSDKSEGNEEQDTDEEIITENEVHSLNDCGENENVLEESEEQYDNRNNEVNIQNTFDSDDGKSIGVHDGEETNIKQDDHGEETNFRQVNTHEIEVKLDDDRVDIKINDGKENIKASDDEGSDIKLENDVKIAGMEDDTEELHLNLDDKDGEFSLSLRNDDKGSEYSEKLSCIDNRSQVDELDTELTKLNIDSEIAIESKKAKETAFMPSDYSNASAESYTNNKISTVHEIDIETEFEPSDYSKPGADSYTNGKRSPIDELDIELTKLDIDTETAIERKTTEESGFEPSDYSKATAKKSPIDELDIEIKKLDIDSDTAIAGETEFEPSDYSKPGADSYTNGKRSPIDELDIELTKLDIDTDTSIERKTTEESGFETSDYSKATAKKSPIDELDIEIKKLDIDSETAIERKTAGESEFETSDYSKAGAHSYTNGKTSLIDELDIELTKLDIDSETAIEMKTAEKTGFEPYDYNKAGTENITNDDGDRDALVVGKMIESFSISEGAVGGHTDNKIFDDVSKILSDLQDEVYEKSTTELNFIGDDVNFSRNPRSSVEPENTDQDIITNKTIMSDSLTVANSTGNELAKEMKDKEMKDKENELDKEMKVKENNHVTANERQTCSELERDMAELCIVKQNKEEDTNSKGVMEDEQNEDTFESLEAVETNLNQADINNVETETVRKLQHGVEGEIHLVFA